MNPEKLLKVLRNPKITSIWCYENKNTSELILEEDYFALPDIEKTNWKKENVPISELKTFLN